MLLVLFSLNSQYDTFAIRCFGPLQVNSSTTKEQMTKFLSANFQKMLRPSYITLRIQRANSVDLDDVAL